MVKRQLFKWMELTGVIMAILLAGGCGIMAQVVTTHAASYEYLGGVSIGLTTERDAQTHIPLNFNVQV